MLFDRSNLCEHAPVRTPIASRNVELDALAAAASNGYVRVYDGAPPASPEDPVTTQHLLVEARFGSPAFAPASDGSIVANPIAPATILLSGTASWFQAVRSDGTTLLWDGNIATSDADMSIASVDLSAGAEFRLNSLSYTLPQ